MELAFVISLLLFTSCGGKPPQQVAEEKPVPVFRMADVPDVITDPAERAGYLVKHYWDNFDFTDTAYIHLPEVTEQAFADYIDIMDYAPYTTVSSSIKDMLKKAEADTSVFVYFSRLYEKYLYDSNSPFRNDEYYIPALEAIIASPLTEEKVRPAHLLAIAKKNRVGEKATDFTYTLTNGQQSTLYAIQSEQTVLFFYNPGCRTCKDIIEQIEASLTIKYLINEERLKLLAVYPDEDLTEWKNYLPEIPKQWINSYDKGTLLQNKEMYDLKAIPTVYLLDKDKKVILKDTSFEQLENYLRTLTN